MGIVPFPETVRSTSGRDFGSSPPRLCFCWPQSVTTHNDESNTPIIPANKAPGMVPDVGYWSASRSVKAYQRRRARLHVHAEMHL
jgi:hypothetical protein